MDDVIEWVRGDAQTKTARLYGASGNANLTGATVKLLFRRGVDDLVEVPCTAIADAEEGEDNVTYDQTAVHSATGGLFPAEFEAVYAGGDRQTFPEDKTLWLKIRDDLNPAP